MHLYSFVINLFGSILQLKYHDTGREKDCLPQVGQWNMMNKVSFNMYMFFSRLTVFLSFIIINVFLTVYVST